MLVVSGFYVASPAVRILKTAVTILIMGFMTCKYTSILGNPGVTHSVPTAFVMNAVGTEWVTPGLNHECSGNGMGHAWVKEDGTRGVFI